MMFKPWLCVLIPGICFFTLVKSQNNRQGNDILYWTTGHRLTFSDFQGKPSEDTTFRSTSPKMLTHKLGSIIQSVNVHFEPMDGKTAFTIHAAMKRNLSWLKDYRDTVLLRHEQGHFDICEIHARILRREIQKAKSLDEAKKIYNKVSIDEESDQDNYDLYNTYQSGGITQEWGKKIINRLSELEPYADPVVILAIDR